jgi:AraC-like DNA-binding protein
MPPNSVFRFSTDAIPADDRLAIWCEVIGRQYMRLDIEPEDGADLRAEIAVHHRPSLQVAVLRATPMRYVRTRVHAQMNDTDFTFARAARGGFTFTDGREDAAFAAGDAALLPNNGTGTIAVAHGDPIMTMRVNGAMLRAAVPDIEGRLVNRLHADNALLRLAVGYLDSVLRCEALDPALAHLAHSHVVDLLALGLDPTGDTRERARHGALPAARLAALRADAVAHLAAPGLSPESVARRQGVSKRYLHRLFEQSGTSFSAFVTEQRLKRAIKLLLDPACAAMRIGEVARSVGFGDLTTFNRAFRQRFGAAPSELRAQAWREAR